MLTSDLVDARTQVTSILDSAGEGICGLDLEGRTTFLNPAGAQAIGWDAGELIGESLHAVLHHSRADGTPYPLEQCPIHSVLREGVTQRVKDEVFWRMDNTPFPVEYVGTPIRGESGEVAGAVVTFRDLTQQRSLEAELVHAQKLESISPLAAGIAHEINTPSQYVGDNIEFLEEEIPRALLQSRDGIGRVTEIVRAMKEFSHPGSEEKRPIDLNRAIESKVGQGTTFTLRLPIAENG